MQTPFIYVYIHRIFGDFQAKHTVCTPYIYGSGQPLEDALDQFRARCTPAGIVVCEARSFVLFSRMLPVWQNLAERERFLLFYSAYCYLFGRTWQNVSAVLTLRSVAR